MARLAGRYLMIEQLLADGTKYVFGNPGTTEQGFMDALQDYPQLGYILSLHEGVATGIADGYARASGRPAFLQLHITPGLGNAMGMLYNSYRAGTPLVVYAGQHPQRGASQDPLLTGDIVRLAEPLTKWAVEAGDAAELPILLRRAFKLALEPPRGPTFISVPANVMDEEAEAQIAPANYVDTKVRPSAEAAERIARLFIDARSPMLLVGDGVSVSGGQAELVQLAELTGARVHSSFAAELPFPSAHPLYQGLLNVVSPSMLKGQLADTDLVVAIGTPVLTLLFPLDEPPFADGTKVVHVDLNARKRLGEPGQNARQESHDVVVGNSDAHCAHEIRAGQGGDGLLVELQNSPRIAQQRLALRCKRDRSALTLKDRFPKRFFQALDLHADCRLRAVDEFAGASKAARICDGDERTQ